MIPRITTIAQGRLRGQACTDERISAFLGVPYGEPPVGELRWRAPRPAERWTGIWNATRFAPAPIQATAAQDPRGCSLGIEGEDTSEDCLYLNVWTPSLDAEANLPVMVWFYGGGNQYGSTADGRYRGEWLAGEGVVVVSVAYRTNVFGFFSHPDLTAECGDEPCANFGYLDQRLALQWVRRNIAAFGGDPGNVTIFGFSSGASSVVAHLCSPMSAGLFRRAISQSGAGVAQANRSLNTLAEAQRIGQRFLHNVLGVRTLAQAHAIEPNALLAAMIEQPPLLDEPSPFTGWDLMLNCPVCVDGKFLTQGIPESFAAGRINPCDLLAGVAAGEFINGPKDCSVQGLEAYARRTFGGLAGEYLAACRGDAGADADTDADTVRERSSYNLFAVGNAAMCDMLLERTAIRPYFYRFSRIPGGDPHGHAGHGSELPYVFGGALMRDPGRYDGADWDLSRMMRRYWANFAAFGDPNGRGLPRWERYCHGSRDAMGFGQGEPAMIRNWLKPSELAAVAFHR